MNLTEPKAHGGTIERLWEARRRGRLPHALLFEGPAGIGKFLSAKWFAAGLFCDGGPGVPCLSCGPCKRVLSGGERGNHPDLFLVDPVSEGEESIRVFRIAHRPDAAGNDDPDHCVESFLDLRALEGRGRVVIVRECHRMNSSAQNALLKTLEEPRPGILLVLETHRPDVLLPTILSRCVRLRMGRLAAEECDLVLREAGLDPDAARGFARWTEGSPGEALNLQKLGVESMHSLLGRLLCAEADALATAQALTEVEGRFLGKTPLAKERDRVRTVCDLLARILRDVVRLEAGLAPAALPFGDLAVKALAARSGWRAEDWERRLELVLTTRADLDRNVSPGALLERMLFGLLHGPVQA